MQMSSKRETSGEHFPFRISHGDTEIRALQKAKQG